MKAVAYGIVYYRGWSGVIFTPGLSSLAISRGCFLLCGGRPGITRR